MAIVILNSVLKVVNTKLIGMIYYRYYSDEISAIVISVFVSQFVNTAFVLPLALADLRKTPLHPLGVVANNLHKDFTLGWYKDIGS